MRVSELPNSLKVLIAAVAVTCVPLAAQTTIDARTQTKMIDFTGATSTRPFKTGTALPTTCGQGDTFLKLDAQAGSNVFACVAANTWSAQGLPAQNGSNGVLTSQGSAIGWTALGGDVTGTAGTVAVTGLQRFPISATPPQSGQALVWGGIAWQPQTIAGGGGGAITVKQGTGSPVTVGARSTLRVLDQSSIVTTLADDGTEINIQNEVNGAVYDSRLNRQSGADVLLECNSRNSTAFVCNVASFAVQSLTRGMVLNWIPDVNGAGGATTVNVSTLGARPLKKADGATDPAASDIVSGMNPIWYDGAAWRLMLR